MAAPDPQPLDVIFSSLVSRPGEPKGIVWQE
jgi:hypothetical protein